MIKKFFSKKQNIVIAGLIGLVLILFAVTIILSRQGKLPGSKTQKTPTPTPTPTPASEPVTGATYEELDQQLADREIAVGQLVHMLPYKGQNFEMIYDIKINQFIVTINRANEEAGRTEFRQFLKKNNIDDPSWISGLFTSIK